VRHVTGERDCAASLQNDRLTRGQFGEFTLYATRTIISGNADELVELAKTNLRPLEAA
jgi:hypothetical protein